MGSPDITRWSGKLRRLFVTHPVIPPLPEAELAMIRHELMDQDSDTSYWCDRKYLEDLKIDVFDAVRSGGFVWETPMPVFSQREYQRIATSLDAAVWEFANIFEGVA